jgi:hypothetical protein
MITEAIYLVNKRLILTLSLTGLFFLSTACSCFAQTTVGVSVEDNFVYNCMLRGSHDKNDSWSVWVPEWNQSKWTVTITAIVDSRVTFNLQVLLSNGTIKYYPRQYIDLFSGGSNEHNYMFFVYPNLNASEPIYLSDSKYIINSTTSRTFASGQREINHINFSSTMDYWDVYADKKTGALVELSETYFDLAGTFSLKLTETSIWTVTTQPSIQPTASPTVNPTIRPSTTPIPTSTNITPSPTIPEISAIIFLIAIMLISPVIVSILVAKNRYLKKNNPAEYNLK